MEAKYYTPKAEEFHVGFEYERKDEDENWVRSVFPDRYVTGYDKWKITSLVEVVYDYLTDGENCRVKHLDREDIEELGWKAETKNGGYYKINKDGVFYWLSFELFYEGLGRNIEINGSGDFPSFDGHIKNKSELKRLMVQLGIIKE